MIGIGGFGVPCRRRVRSGLRMGEDRKEDGCFMCRRTAVAWLEGSNGHDVDQFGVASDQYRTK